MSQVIPSSRVDRRKVSQEDIRRSVSNATQLTWIWKHQTKRETTNHSWTLCCILHTHKKKTNFLKKYTRLWQSMLWIAKLWDTKWVPGEFRMSQRSHSVQVNDLKFEIFPKVSWHFVLQGAHTQMNGSIRWALSAVFRFWFKVWQKNASIILSIICWHPEVLMRI